MATAAWCLLGAAAAAGVVAQRPYAPAFLPAVELNIVAERHILLIVGNPGRFVRLRPNVHIDRMVLHGELGDVSRTYSQPLASAAGSDIFYIGPFKLRMPVVGSVDDATVRALEDAEATVGGGATLDDGANGGGGDIAEQLLRDAEHVFGEDRDDDDSDSDAESSSSSSSSVAPDRGADEIIDDDDDDVRLIYTEYVTQVLAAGGGGAAGDDTARRRWQQVFATALGSSGDNDYDGEFALGPGAAIWRYWANFTLSADSLTLGAVDRYLQRDVRERATMLPVVFYYPLRTRQPLGNTAAAATLLSGNAAAAAAHGFAPHAKRGGGGHAAAHVRHALIERILAQRYGAALPRDYAPRGAPVVLGRIGERLYKIVLDHNARTTYVPRHLRHGSADGFDIELGDLHVLLRDIQRDMRRQRRGGGGGGTAEQRAAMHDFIDSGVDEAARARNGSATVLHFSLADHRVLTAGSDAASYGSAVRDSPLDDVLVFGEHTLRHLVLFFDARHMRVSLAPSYRYAAPAAALQALGVHYMSVLVATTLVVWWLVAANARVLWQFTAAQQRELATALGIVSMLQLAGSLQCAACAVVLCAGYDVQRYMAHYVRTEHAARHTAALCAVAVALCAAGTVHAALTLARIVEWRSTAGAVITAQHDHRQRLLAFAVRRWLDTASARRFALECPALAVLWLCGVRRHQTLVDVLYLLFVASVLAATATLSALDAHFHRRPYRVVVAVGAAGAYAFLYAYNLVPAATFVWGASNAYRHSLAAVYAIAFVFAPCVYVYSLYRKRLFAAHIARHRASLAVRA